jgi:hypothetical protein
MSFKKINGRFHYIVPDETVDQWIEEWIPNTVYVSSGDVRVIKEGDEFCIYRLERIIKETK